MAFKMRKMIVLLLIALFVAFSSPAWAVSANRIRSTAGIESSDALTLPAATWVYGWKVYADAASSFAALYDATTYVGKTVANAVDEIGEATQYDSVEVWFPEPIYFENGVSVYMTTGVAFIFYGPPPTQ